MAELDRPGADANGVRSQGVLAPRPCFADQRRPPGGELGECGRRVEDGGEWGVDVERKVVMVLVGDGMGVRIFGVGLGETSWR